MKLEELVLQTANSGVELIALYYLIRTLPAINELSNSIRNLTEKLNVLDKKVSNIELELQRRNFNEQSHYSRN